MAEIITTTLVINFDGGEESTLQAEIDSREDGLNGGITSFIPGDSPYFLVFKTDDVSTTLDTTTGTINSMGTGIYKVEETLTFTNTRESALSKPAEGTVTRTVLSGTLPELQLKYNKLITSEKTIGVVKVEYDSRYHSYQLNDIPDNLAGETTFPIIILITGTVDS